MCSCWIIPVTLTFSCNSHYGEFLSPWSSAIFSHDDIMFTSFAPQPSFCHDIIRILGFKCMLVWFLQQQIIFVLIQCCWKNVMFTVVLLCEMSLHIDSSAGAQSPRGQSVDLLTSCSRLFLQGIGHQLHCASYDAIYV